MITEEGEKFTSPFQVFRGFSIGNRHRTSVQTALGWGERQEPHQDGCQAPLRRVNSILHSQHEDPSPLSWATVLSSKPACQPFIGEVKQGFWPSRWHFGLGKGTSPGSGRPCPLCHTQCSVRTPTHVPWERTACCLEEKSISETRAGQQGEKEEGRSANENSWFIWLVFRDLFYIYIHTFLKDKDFSDLSKLISVS